MASSSNEMDLYAEPIPPTLVGKPQPNLSRANFREVVMRRLTAVQEQKKSLNTTPIRQASNQSDFWKTEKEILVEMLEKTQKLQLTSQLAWNQEREELEKQLKRLEASYRTQVEALKQDNDRLRNELTKSKSLEEEVNIKSELTQQLQDLTKRHQDKEEALTTQIHTLEFTLTQYKEGLDKATEELEKKRFLADEHSVVAEAKAEETISSLRKELTQTQLLLKEKEIAILTQAQELALAKTAVDTLKKKKLVKTAGIQTEVKSAEIARMESQLDERQRELSALRTQMSEKISTAKEEFIKEIQVLQSANNVLKAQVAGSESSSHVPVSQETLLNQTRDILLQLLQNRRSIPKLPEELDDLRKFLHQGKDDFDTLPQLQALLKSRLEELIERCQPVPSVSSSSDDERAKVCLETYVFSLRALQDLAKEQSSGNVDHTQMRLLQIDNDRLKKERAMLISSVKALTEANDKSKELGEKVLVLKGLFERLGTDIDTTMQIYEIRKGLEMRCEATGRLIDNWISSFQAKNEALAATESILLTRLQTLFETFSNNTASEASRLEGEKQIALVKQQKERLEEAMAKLKTLYDGETEHLMHQYETYQELVNSERSRISDNLLKIAESVEYRRDIWEQFQSAEDEPGDEEQTSHITELSEELERQTEWEIKTLALLLSKLQDPLEKTPPRDVNEIKEESEEDEGESDGVETVVVRLR